MIQIKTKTDRSKWLMVKLSHRRRLLTWGHFSSQKIIFNNLPDSILFFFLNIKSFSMIGGDKPWIPVSTYNKSSKMLKKNHSQKGSQSISMMNILILNSNIKQRCSHGLSSVCSSVCLRPGSPRWGLDIFLSFYFHYWLCLHIFMFIRLFCSQSCFSRWTHFWPSWLSCAPLLGEKYHWGWGWWWWCLKVLLLLVKKL